MTTFPGVATLSDGRVPVTVGLDHERISLVSGDRSIREWRAGECEVVEVETGTFLITDDADAISFQPDDPGSFARGLALWSRPTSTRRQDADTSGPLEPAEAPPPGKATMLAFYVMAGVTAVLMVWALLRVLT